MSLLETETDVFNYIFSFTNTEQDLNKKLKRAYRLERMEILLRELGNPERAFTSVHIAGTKGKGSTAAFIANALASSGIKTGLYTSPHVVSPIERMDIPGYTTDIKALISSANIIRETVANIHLELEGYKSPTTFELLTALAFLYFKNTGCKFAVVETGIGGRLDATNVITPMVSVITPINREHTDILGDTLEKIAFEKAGIIKSGIPVFSSKQRIEAKRILIRESSKKRTSIHFVEEEIQRYTSQISIRGTRVWAKFKNGREISFSTKLIGDFQTENALLAYLVTENILRNINQRDKINSKDITRKIISGFRNTTLPGRFEILPINREKNIYIVLDGAHTPVAIRKILKNFKQLFRGTRLLIFGAVKGKNYREMAKHLASNFEKIIVSKPDPFKESEPEKIFNFFKKLNPHTYLELNPSHAMEKAIKLLNESSLAANTLAKNVILVTGSFYMISEIEHILKSNSSKTEGKRIEGKSGT